MECDKNEKSKDYYKADLKQEGLNGVNRQA